jgi:hypothetical protein
MIRAILTVVFCVLFASIAYAQTPTTPPQFPVGPNEPFKVRWDSPVDPTHVFKFGCVNTVTGGTPAPAPVTFTDAQVTKVGLAGPVLQTHEVTISTGLPVGSFACAVSVGNAFTIANNIPDVLSDFVLAMAGIIPAKPLNLILIKVQ